METSMQLHTPVRRSLSSVYRKITKVIPLQDNWSTMSQEPVSTRIPSDDKRALERYCSERGVSKSEALRRSIRQLGHDRKPDDEQVDGNSSLSDPIWRGTILTGLFYAGLSSSGFIPDVLIPVLGALILVIGTYSLVR
jgi:hypothetical protein